MGGEKHQELLLQYIQQGVHSAFPVIGSGFVSKVVSN